MEYFLLSFFFYLDVIGLGSRNFVEHMCDSNKTANESGQNESHSTLQVGNQAINLSHQNKNNSGRVKNFIEFNKKYEKFFSETS